MPSLFVPGNSAFKTVKWRDVEERRTILKEEHAKGASLARLANILEVSASTIERDCEHLGLKTFSDISDERLTFEIADVLNHGHEDMGYRDVECALQRRQIRVQERRIRALLPTRPSPMTPKKKRRGFAAYVGPDFVWSMDQNEKLTNYGFKILAVLDAFSKKPLYWKVVKDLRGSTHCRFFAEAVAVAGKAPANVTVDHARAWGGVREMICHVHGNPDAISIFESGGEVFTAKPFNPTKSVHNIVVERHWRGTNKITFKWKREFKLLESLGAFGQGDRGDMFSLAAVYENAIVDEVDAHYEALQLSKKSKSTKNPDFPSGLKRRSELYDDFESLGTDLNEDEIRALAAVGAAHVEIGDLAIGREVPPWQVDPLVDETHRAARAEALESLAPLTLAERYVAHRSFTRAIVETPGTSGAACIAGALTSAACGVAHLRGLVSSAVAVAF